MSQLDHMTDETIQKILDLCQDRADWALGKSVEPENECSAQWYRGIHAGALQVKGGIDKLLKGLTNEEGTESEEAEHIQTQEEVRSTVGPDHPKRGGV